MPRRAKKKNKLKKNNTATSLKTKREQQSNQHVLAIVCSPSKDQIGQTTLQLINFFKKNSNVYGVYDKRVLVGHKSPKKVPQGVVTSTPKKRPLAFLYTVCGNAEDGRLYFFESSPRRYSNQRNTEPPTLEKEKEILEKLPYLDESTKIIEEVKLDKATIKLWRGEPRVVSQRDVMGGVSADVYALMHGLPVDKYLDYQWCHLAAHSVGGPDGINPQVQRNLVVGSRACNRQMIPFESAIKELLTSGELDHVSLTVEALLMPVYGIKNKFTHIARSIFYIMRCDGAEYIVEFDAQTHLGVHRDFKKLIKESIKQHLTGSQRTAKKVTDIIGEAEKIKPLSATPTCAVRKLSFS